MNNMDSFRILVKYEHKHGYHVFTSPDIDALYITSKNIKTAFKAIVPNLRTIYAYKLNVCIDNIEVKSSVSFSAFEKRIRPSESVEPHLLHVKAA